MRFHLGVLGFESFSHYCKFPFVSKIIFQSLPVDVGIMLNHINYCVIFYLHLFITAFIFLQKSQSLENW